MALECFLERVLLFSKFIREASSLPQRYSIPCCEAKEFLKEHFRVYPFRDLQDKINEISPFRYLQEKNVVAVSLTFADGVAAEVTFAQALPNCLFERHSEGIPFPSL